MPEPMYGYRSGLSTKGKDDRTKRAGYLKKNTAPTASMKSQQNRYLLFNSPKSEKLLKTAGKWFSVWTQNCCVLICLQNFPP